MPSEEFLYIRHRGEAKPVGRVICRSGHWLCLHEESGTQEIDLFPCLGGVDTVAALYLQQSGVEFWHHWTKPAGPLWMVTLDRLIASGVEKIWDGRRRLFLPSEQWKGSLDLIPYDRGYVRKEKIITEADLLSPLPAGRPQLVGASSALQPSLFETDDAEA